MAQDCPYNTEVKRIVLLLRVLFQEEVNNASVGKEYVLQVGLSRW